MLKAGIVGQRRWSFDEADAARSARGVVPPPAVAKRSDHLDPVLPFLRNWSSFEIFRKTVTRSEPLEDFIRAPNVCHDTGIWQYSLQDGRLQNFDDNHLNKRWSFNERSQFRGLPPFITEPSRREHQPPVARNLTLRLAGYLHGVSTKFRRRYQYLNQHRVLPSCRAGRSLSTESSLYTSASESSRAGCPDRDRPRWSFDDRDFARFIGV